MLDSARGAFVMICARFHLTAPCNLYAISDRSAPVCAMWLSRYPELLLPRNPPASLLARGNSQRDLTSASVHDDQLMAKFPDCQLREVSRSAGEGVPGYRRNFWTRIRDVESPGRQKCFGVHDLS